MKHLLATFAAVVLAAATAQAAPLDVKNIPADAKWVVHVDVDAVRNSQVVQKAFATCPILKNDAGKHFDMIRDKIGIDLRTDLHGITLYGPDTDKEHGVAIVFSTVNDKLLLEKAQKAADHKVTKHGDVEIHSWTMKHGGKTHTAAGAFFKPDVLVFAANADRVAAALDVLDGKSPAFAGRGLRRIQPGTTLLIWSTAIPPKTKCPVLKQADSFRVAMGENDGKSFYRARLAMKTPEAAAQIKTINEGFKAIVSLKFSDDADVMKLVDGFKTTVQDKAVRITWEASADDVWTVVEKLGKKAAEQMKAHAAKKDAKDAHPKAEKKTSADSDGCQCPCCKAKAK